MALTKAQEEYLKGLGIGKGAGRGGALSGAGSGAAKGAAIGSVIPGLGTVAGGVIGGVVGGLKGWLGGRGKAKKAQAEARARLEQANATFNRAEDTRLAKAGIGSSLLKGLAGSGVAQVDPETLAQITTRRELDPAEAGLWNEFAGAGSEGAASALGDLEDYAVQYGMNRADAGDAGGGYTNGLGISAGQPIGGLRGSFQDTLGSSGFGSNENWQPGGGVGPQRVSLDDLRNLYKLGGSGTANFG